MVELSTVNDVVKSPGHAAHTSFCCHAHSREEKQFLCRIFSETCHVSFFRPHGISTGRISGEFLVCYVPATWTYRRERAISGNDNLIFSTDFRHVDSAFPYATNEFPGLNKLSDKTIVKSCGTIALAITTQRLASTTPPPRPCGCMRRQERVPAMLPG